MKRSLLIGVAALAVACGGGSSQSRSRDAAAAAQAGGDQGGATQTNQTVTLVGCLAGDDPFLLVDAIVPGAEIGAANGAGRSGEPLVTGTATFELDGVPVEVRDRINTQVKVVGRLDARPMPTSGTGARRVTGTSGSSGADSIPSGSRESDSAHGTGQKSVAGHGTMGSAARSDVRNQRLVVESVQVIAETCTQR